MSLLSTEPGGALRVGHCALDVSAGAAHVTLTLEPHRGSHTILRLAPDQARLVGSWLTACATAAADSTLTRHPLADSPAARLWRECAEEDPHNPLWRELLAEAKR